MTQKFLKRNFIILLRIGLIQREKMQNSANKDFLDQLFLQFDINRSKRLNVVELMNYYNQFNRRNAIPLKFDSRVVQPCLIQCDLNKDQGISREEYQTYLNKVLGNQVPKKIFYPFLCDRVDEELKRKISEAIKYLDKNKTGKLGKYQLANYYNILYHDIGIPIQISPSHTERILLHHKKDGFNHEDMFNFIKEFKANPNPKYILIDN